MVASAGAIGVNDPGAEPPGPFFYEIKRLIHFSIVQNHGGCKGFPKEMLVSGVLHFCRCKDGVATKMKDLMRGGLAGGGDDDVNMLLDSVGYVG